jgi:hypothetical protein
VIAPKVVPEQEVFAMLKRSGFERTARKTNTGTFWKHTSGKHLLVPSSVQGFCPDWWLEDLTDRITRMGVELS